MGILTRAGFVVETIRDALADEPGVVAFRGRRSCPGPRDMLRSRAEVP